MDKIIHLLAILAVLIAMGCLQEGKAPVACPEDAKICPDGTAVTRVPPDCEFAPCPGASTDTPPPEHYPETPTPTFQPACVDGEVKNTTCPDGVTVYASESCANGTWHNIYYFRDPCSPLPTPDASGMVWLELEPVQCLGNPWEQDWLASHEMDYRSYPREREAEIIKDYYARMGITVYDVKSERKYEYVCEACSCPRGDVLYLQISAAHLDRMIELGFKASSEM